MSNRLISISVLFLVSLALASQTRANDRIVTKEIEDNGDCLINPDMGLCHYAYAGRLWAYGSKNPAWDTLDWFPGVSTVYMRVLWSDIEPAEGQYRWDIFDRYAMPWIEAGKKIAIRIICCNQTSEACPDYVREAGAKGHYFIYERPGTGLTFPPRWEPEYDDPVFIEKLTALIKAFAKRYDGNPDVAFVDIGSFGIYGEGHSSFLDKLIVSDPEKYNKQVQMHLRLWRENMPNTYLVISDDVSGNWNTDEDHPNMQVARELGIGFRDDSIFCQERSWYHDGWARKFADTMPVVLETGHLTELDYDSKIDYKRGLWHADMLLKCIEDHRASYFSIHDYPEIHLKRYKKILRQIANRIGYRFVLENIQYPAVVSPDTEVTITSTWSNAGVAPCCRDYFLTWSLLDASGHICWCCTDSEFSFRSLPPTINGNKQSTMVESKIYLGHTQINPMPDNCLVWARQTDRNPGEINVMLPDGKYTLCVSVGNAMGTPEVALPMKGYRERRLYPIGKISVVSGK